MRSVPTFESRPRGPQRRIISPLTPEFSIFGYQQLTTTVASSAWFSANDPLALPFRISDGGVVTQLAVCHGTAAGGNFDIGVYDDAWNRLVSTGSTAATGNSRWQFVDVTDTGLQAFKRYFLVLARDNATANRQRTVQGGSVANMAFAGCYDSATNAFPLPDPLTNMALVATATVPPLVAVCFRDAYV